MDYVSKISQIFAMICQDFKEKTNLQTNYIEYLSALLYLKYYHSQNFEMLYQKRNDFYIQKRIDDLLEQLRFHLNNATLFSNLSFSKITFFREIGETHILSQMIEELYFLEKNIAFSEKDILPYVAQSYESVLEDCVKKNDIVNASHEFYTPLSIAKLIAALTDFHALTLYDPCCGTGNILLQMTTLHWKKIVGSEPDISIYNLCMTNLFLHQISNRVILFQEESSETFDLIVSNPPFSQKNLKKFISPKDSHYVSFESLMFQDYAFVLQMLDRLSENGKMIIVLPHGVLFRQNELMIRKKLVEENLIEAIIGLPSHMFYSTRIPVILLILSRNKTDSSILFIDASDQYVSQKNISTFSSENISMITRYYQRRREKDHFSKLVSFSEIQENNYNLSIKRYIKREGEEKKEIQNQEILKNLKNLNMEITILEDNIYDVLKSLNVDADCIPKFNGKKEIIDFDPIVIGEKIQRFRKKNNYTLMELAREIGITADCLMAIENGKIRVSTSTLVTICRVLHISISDLFS